MPKETHKYDYLEGMKINDITVLKKLGRIYPEKRMTYWECRCDLCGETFQTYTHYLLPGKEQKKSCTRCAVKRRGEESRVLKEGQILPSGIKVVSYNELLSNKVGRNVWNCICPECGQFFKTTTPSLTGGNGKYKEAITCCQVCSQKRAHNNHKKYAPGMIIGDIEILKEVSHKQGRMTRWKCKCLRCGDIFTISAENIKKKMDKSCRKCAKHPNRYRMLDLNGKQFGELLVLESIMGGNRKTDLLKCRCKCGDIRTYNRQYVLAGKNTQCPSCAEQAYKDKLAEEALQYEGMVAPSGVKIKKRAYHEDGSHKHWMFVCECPECGNDFISDAPSVLRDDRRSTKSCGCLSESNYEAFIKRILNENNIKYTTQYKFPDCRNVYPLPFDFAIINNDGSVRKLIEYDGEQHYKSRKHFGGSKAYADQVKRDNIKTQYCKEHGIPLIRIPYYYSDSRIKKIILDAIA